LGVFCKRKGGGKASQEEGPLSVTLLEGVQVEKAGFFFASTTLWGGRRDAVGEAGQASGEMGKGGAIPREVCKGKLGGQRGWEIKRGGVIQLRGKGK